jgi:DNA mismatch repair ATPase MutS
MTVTPLRKQYLRVKQKYPEAIAFFQLGDFYETFDEDASLKFLLAQSMPLIQYL